MICKVCGRTIMNEEANFCEYCGASFRPGMDNRIAEEEMHKQTIGGYTDAGQDSFRQQTGSMYENAQSVHNQTYQAYQGSTQKAAIPKSGGLFSGSDKPMTFGNWMLVYLIPFIPMVGTILFLVLLFSWGFGSNVAQTKKNWARATLVFGLVMIVLLFVLMSGGLLGEYTSVLEGLYGSGVS